MSSGNAGHLNEVGIWNMVFSPSQGGEERKGTSQSCRRQKPVGILCSQHTAPEPMSRKYQRLLIGVFKKINLHAPGVIPSVIWEGPGALALILWEARYGMATLMDVRGGVGFCRGEHITSEGGSFFIL